MGEFLHKHCGAPNCHRQSSRQDRRNDCEQDSTVCFPTIFQLTPSPYAQIMKVEDRRHPKPLRVIACYRMCRGDAQYGEITYLAKGIDWEAVEYPAEYRYLRDLLLAVHA